MSAYPVSPASFPQTSHLRSTTTTNPNPATRSLQAAETAKQPQQPQPFSLSAPASQESFVSVQSDGSSTRPYLQSSSSNLSQLTNYTEPTSPGLAAVPPQQDAGHGSNTAAPRAKTPEHALQRAQLDGDYALASPMSVSSPMNGAKRTASGHVKNAPSLSSTPMDSGRRSRAESISSTGSRASELAATLKTRLNYAMAKVQHGWEHKNIAEVEQLAAQKASASPNRHSMSHVDYSRRPMSAGLSNGFSRVSVNAYQQPSTLDGTTSPPSKRRSGTFSQFLVSPQQQQQYGTAPRLQPSADIRPTSRNYGGHAYATGPSSQSTNHSSAMSPPRTPLNGHPRRPGTIRTDTQTAEAERDALQALFQLGSPHASQVSRQAAASQASSAQASPMMSTPRRVTFARSESGGSSAQGSSAEEQ